MEVLIRAAVPADAAGIAQVHTQSWAETYRGLIPDDFLDRMTSDAMRQSRAEGWRTQRLTPDPARPVLVAEQRGEIVAFASGGPAPQHPGYDSELYTLYSLKRVQGQGTGRALLQAVAGELHAQGAKNMALWVLDVNPTRQWYARQGASEAGEKTDGPLREIRMVWDDLGTLIDKNPHRYSG